MRKFLLLIILLIWSLPADAQVETSPDEALVIAQLPDYRSWMLKGISPAGVREIAPIYYPDLTHLIGQAAFPRLEISADYRKLLLRDWNPYDPMVFFHLYDVENSREITLTPLAHPIGEGLPPLPIASMHISGFSPDETQVAFAHTLDLREAPDLAAQYNTQYVVQVYTMDIATGAVTASINLFDYADFNPETVYLGEWTEAGVQISPTSECCHPSQGGIYWRWQPTTGTLEPSGEMWTLDGEYLPATGEFANPATNREMPLDWSLESDFFSPVNVLEIYTDGQFPDWSVPSLDHVVYHDTYNISDSRAHWVMGGKAVLLLDRNTVLYRGGSNGTERPWNPPILVRRDGTFQMLADLHLLAGEFVTATEDGWIMLTDIDEGVYYYHYTFEDDNLVATKLPDQPQREILIRPVERPVPGRSD